MHFDRGKKPVESDKDLEASLQAMSLLPREVVVVHLQHRPQSSQVKVVVVHPQHRPQSSHVKDQFNKQVILVVTIGQFLWKL